MKKLGLDHNRDNILFTVIIDQPYKAAARVCCNTF